jgi:polysaccharide biosynthesis protein PslE
VATGLDQKKGFLERFLGTADPQTRRAQAVQHLGKKLVIEPVKKTNLIQVSYANWDPKFAAAVLRSLAELYLKKHVEVNRSPGTFNFFQQQAAEYRGKLGDAEAHLSSFSREHGAASPRLERDLTVQKLADALATLRQTQASIAGTELRVRNLEVQLASTPERATTQEHTADSAALLDQLKPVLLSLELKRIDLLKKYSPTYPLVQEVDEQISQTRAAIEAAEKTHSHDQTTDKDTTHEMLRQDLAKAKEELAALKASAIAMEASIQTYRQMSVKLDGEALAEQDLEREAKADEDSYLLYLRKQEDARTADGLDSRRILNVSIAEAAAVPVLPFFSPALFVVLGGLLAIVVSLGSAFIADRMDPSFRTPDEVRQLLNVPVLASLPKNGHDVPVRVLTVGSDR